MSLTVGYKGHSAEKRLRMALAAVEEALPLGTEFPAEVVLHDGIELSVRALAETRSVVGFNCPDPHVLQMLQMGAATHGSTWLALDMALLVIGQDERTLALVGSQNAFPTFLVNDEAQTLHNL